ncbi:hypothetical protein KM043_006869 [Ampulex compressa]|nr:hypothetical protein KM043_006869 [Ampulex compressa]
MQESRQPSGTNAEDGIRGWGTKMKNQAWQIGGLTNVGLSHVQWSHLVSGTRHENKKSLDARRPPAAAAASNTGPALDRPPEPKSPFLADCSGATHISASTFRCGTFAQRNDLCDCNGCICISPPPSRPIEPHVARTAVLSGRICSLASTYRDS